MQAGLTILKAYHHAGRPEQKIRPFGRFEEWSNLVRSAIVWLELPDPCESRKGIEESDLSAFRLNCFSLPGMKYTVICPSL